MGQKLSLLIFFPSFGANSSTGKIAANDESLGFVLRIKVRVSAESEGKDERGKEGISFLVNGFLLLHTHAY